MTSQQNTKIPTDWDVDVIDYWNASLSSYKKHHEYPDQEVDSEAVTKDFLDSLPVKQKQEIIAETEPVIPQATPHKSSVKRKAPIQEVVEVTQESQIGAWSYVDKSEELEVEEEEHEPSQEYNDQQAQQDYYYSQEGEDTSGKRPRYEAPQPPPPPPGLPQDNEALSNLIMAWYYAGYYTGLYQAGKRH